jgi:hypothetical protein
VRFFRAPPLGEQVKEICGARGEEVLEAEILTLNQTNIEKH